jgi:hypothetical protein
MHAFQIPSNADKAPFKVFRHTMLIRTRGDRKIIWRVRNARANAGVRPGLIVMRNPASQNIAQVVFRQRDKKVQAFTA